ncbi:hypothetical protein JQ620_15795 [Bradyrhizobium sp. AUGA SZCCT0274]|uniref:hypothetical protein n=1 Tax=Bradyrhizobium sp. AUGA SZCCT0274 TaxID=2807670 RepID=UPI001BA4E1F5|nr:hypothetical protein [Bradyrhizobium sp. AUGA SZCCT0274]MBR1241592.1 hypothetical protein [Bradyrhizobium sp. AUGA SZCCT0274]
MTEPTTPPTIPAMNPQQAQAYKDATDNLIYLKREQFQVTYYTWLLLAALYILSRQLKSDILVLQVGVVAVTAASIAILWTFQRNINRFRERLNYIYGKYFDEAERKGLGLNATDPHRGVVLFLTLVCVVAGGFTLKVMLSSPVP